MTIKKGDLVQVIRPRTCCPQFTRFGYVTTALETKIKSGSDRLIRCPFCETIYEYFGHVSMLSKDSWIESFRLLKIDPPSTGETTRAYRGLKETA
jgi:hypothetical protein